MRHHPQHRALTIVRPSDRARNIALLVLGLAFTAFMLWLGSL